MNTSLYLQVLTVLDFFEDDLYYKNLETNYVS